MFNKILTNKERYVILMVADVLYCSLTVQVQETNHTRLKYSHIAYHRFCKFEGNCTIVSFYAKITLQSVMLACVFIVYTEPDKCILLKTVT